MSDSSIRTNPSIEEPSNMISPSSALRELAPGHLDVLVDAHDVGELQPDEVDAEPVRDLEQVLLARPAQVGREVVEAGPLGRAARALLGVSHEVGLLIGETVKEIPEGSGVRPRDRRPFPGSRIRLRFCPDDRDPDRLPGLRQPRAAGKFCSACGASLLPRSCANCKADLTPQARFCHRCGRPAGAAPSSDRPVRPSGPASRISRPT